ncbi:MAG TPA: hypothetical protein VMT34_18670 [Aggregatilineales bacterium]|nr:hypothetical protein [Aggregatilineales bacterium]
MAPPPNTGDANNVNDDDPLGGMDPMAWLESLAARQGAKPEELTTAADLDIPTPPADAKVTGPGYTPGYESTKKPAATPPEPVKPPATPKAPEPVMSTSSEDDLLGGLDPMAWLESLAARQGANPEELTTAHNLDIPVPPADAKVTGPGYTPGYDSPRKPAPAQPEPVKPPEPPKTPEPVMATSSEDDLLGGLDPMAWLESLAARQGARPEELMTAANLDIPIPPADAKDTGPGYTPGYESPRKPAVTPPEPVKAPEPVEPPVAVEPPEPVMATSSEDDLLGGMDPMAWLESLAARQGANPEELTTAANLDIPIPSADAKVTGPGYTPGYESPNKPAATTPEPIKAPEPIEPPVAVEPPEPVMAEPPEAPEPVMVAADDLLGGMDPMTWLESLARHQGAPEEELTTAANLEIPAPPADAKVTGPGYVDFDPFSGIQMPTREQPAVTTPLPVPEASVEPEIPAEPVGVGSGDDLISSVDALAWLETLAINQGANPEEMVTAPESQAQPPSEVETPAPPEAVMSEAEAADLLGIGSAGEAGPNSDPLAWLEDLAASPDEAMFSTSIDFRAFEADTLTDQETMAPESALSWLEELAATEGKQLPTPAAEPAPESRTGPMSDDINEVQRWLEQQARSLELTRQQLEAEESEEELPPAEAATEIPDWLRAAAPTLDSTVSPVGDAVVPSLDPGELPPWLAESAVDEQQTVRDFDAMFEEAEPEEPEPVAAAPQAPIQAEDLDTLTRPASESEVDSWAEALDEEYERRQAGDESVPDWYLEALARLPAAAVEVTTGETALSVDYESIVAAEESAIEPTPLEDIPDWLRGIAETMHAVPAAPAIEPAPVDAWVPSAVEVNATDLPDWLKPAEAEASVMPSAPIVPEAPVTPEVPVVTAEPPKPATVVPEAPTPVAATEPPPVPTPPVVPPPPVVPTPVPVPPPVSMAPPVPVQPAKRVEPPKPAAVPAPEHHARLRQARQLVDTGQDSASLEHYQALVDSAQLLEETRADLRGLVEKNPKEPRIRRLLGDTHMRLGDLQAALDTYRSALDQL